ncbi:hypothetical protein B0H16DRAFT_1849220 [Mycena metata]|uniref:F-box domain-containing protein n=1 Tax=Mycena metata TaxID=1033252 RepID=A0AAD7IQG3_9AGAR|nr:hypothetical protein B0H16DRAFT_1849220 [Mycena metata]
MEAELTPIRDGEFDGNDDEISLAHLFKPTTGTVWKPSMSTIPADAAFPVELEERIFTIAASLHPRSMPSMILVARRVQTWYLLSSKSALNSRPAQQNIRSICITDYTDEVDLQRILSTFKGLTRLDIPFFDLEPALLPFLAQYLSIKLLPLFGADVESTPVDFTHPMFAHITHLDVQELNFEEPPESSQPARWSGWSHLTSLTHISFWNYHDRPLFEEIVASCPKLQVLIVVVASEQMTDNSVFAECAHDPRFILLVVKDFLDDWGADATGGENYWTRADNFLAERRSARIEASR